MTTTRAWVAREYGDYHDVLSLESRAVPEPSETGVLVQMSRAALNFPDILAIAGRYQVRVPPPFCPGTEGVGRVLRAGPGANIEVGTRVIVNVLSGAFAEIVSAEALGCFAVPDSMSDDDAAAISVTYQTAWFALHVRAKTMPGEVVLIHGAAGGVGMALVQLAKAHGTKVIATASTREKADACVAQGADHAIVTSEKDFVAEVSQMTAGRGADVIMDVVGGDTFTRSTKCIAFEGRLVVLGFTSGSIPEIAANRILLKNIAIVGLNWPNYQLANRQAIDDAHAGLMAAYADGKIRPVVRQVFDRDDLVAALDAIASRRAIGKVLLRLDT